MFPLRRTCQYMVRAVQRNEALRMLGGGEYLRGVGYVNDIIQRGMEDEDRPSQMLDLGLDLLPRQAVSAVR